MSIVDRFKASWELVKLSWHVLMQDKELLLFPILSTIGAVFMFIFIVVPALLAHAGWFSLIIAYFAAAYVVIFMNTSLIACVRKRLAGGNPTIGYGLKEAGKRWLPILLWSLITTTVGILLRMASSKSREQGGVGAIIGQIIVGIIGFAWTIVTMFVIPVMVFENLGVIDSLKRSGQLVRKTWGEQIIITVGISTAFGYLYAALIAICVITLLLTPAMLLGTVLVCIAIAALLLIFQNTLEGIFNAVLYSYAAGDNIPSEFKGKLSTIFVKKN